MKNLRTLLLSVSFTAIGFAGLDAAELASAKVTNVKGSVSVYPAEGKYQPLKSGDILKEGDGVVAAHMSSAELVFSNGSTLKINDKTSVTIATLDQESYGGNRHYGQLNRDPSKSTTLLDLNYGSVRGEVKNLREESSFDIDTPLGRAAIHGTTFFVDLKYNAEIGQFVLTVQNEDGLVDVISRYAGELQFGRSNTADVGYMSNLDEEKRGSLPPRHRVIIRLSNRDPNFNAIIGAIENYPAFTDPAGRAPTVVTVDGPVVTPEDPGVIVVSPEGSSQQGNSSND